MQQVYNSFIISFLSFMVVSMFMLKTTNTANLENKHLMLYNSQNDKKKKKRWKIKLINGSSIHSSYWANRKQYFFISLSFSFKCFKMGTDLLFHNYSLLLFHNFLSHTVEGTHNTVCVKMCDRILLPWDH